MIIIRLTPLKTCVSKTQVRQSASNVKIRCRNYSVNVGTAFLNGIFNIYKIALLTIAITVCARPGLAATAPEGCEPVLVKKHLGEKHQGPVPKLEPETGKVLITPVIEGKRYKFQRMPGIEDPVSFSEIHLGGKSELLDVVAGTRWVIENSNHTEELIKIFRIENPLFSNVVSKNRLQKLVKNIVVQLIEKVTKKTMTEDALISTLINVEIELYLLAKQNGIRVAELLSTVTEIEVGMFRVRKIRGATLADIFEARPDLKLKFTEHKIKSLENFYEKLFALRHKANAILKANGLEVITQNPYTGETDKHLGIDMAPRNVMVEYSSPNTGEKIVFEDGRVVWIDIENADPILVDF